MALNRILQSVRVSLLPTVESMLRYSVKKVGMNMQQYLQHNMTLSGHHNELK